MDSTLTYTVKAGDGYISLARFVFEQSPRAYIQSLAKRYDMLKEAAAKIESDLKSEYINFKLVLNQKVTLHSDPGYYVPRLSLIAKHDSLTQQATKKATSVAQDDNYFVIHNTAGNYDDEQLEHLVSTKKSGAGHAYISKKGKVFKIWPYNSPKGWATRSEWNKYKPDLRGKLVHIELVYTASESPTEEQYKALADIYKETKDVFNKYLPITGHREIDRGIKGGHSDPIGFDFKHFYKILKSKGIPIEDIKKQDQNRFDKDTQCEHEWSWPPTLEGITFLKVSADVYKSKGCK